MPKLFCCEICSAKEKNACPMPVEAVRNMHHFQSCPMENFHEKYCYECMGELKAPALLKLCAPSKNKSCAGWSATDPDAADSGRKCALREESGVRAMIVQSHEMEYAPKLTKLYELRGIATQIFNQSHILMLAEIMRRIRG